MQVFVEIFFLIGLDIQVDFCPGLELLEAKLDSIPYLNSDSDVMETPQPASKLIVEGQYYEHANTNEKSTTQDLQPAERTHGEISVSSKNADSQNLEYTKKVESGNTYVQQHELYTRR